MRRLFSLLHRTLSVPSGDPELSHAQFRAMSKQVPLLYFILIVNCLAVSFTFSRLAPLWLSVFLPVGLSTVAGIRGLKWWLARHKEVSPAEALSSLRKTNLMAGVLAAGFTAWGLCLYHYGDATARGHVVFFMAITVIGCILCLMHLRSAAIMVTLVVNIPFVIFMAVVGGLTEKAIAVNVVLVSGAVIVILMTHYRDFTLLVRSRRDLMAKQAETQALSDENFRIANLDALTDLPNRRRFFHDMGQAFADAANGGAPLAVCAIDLDGFKPVNDTYGHATGDRVLIEAARRLRQVCVGFTDAQAETYRLGGDEFGVIVRGAPEPRVLEALGGGLTESLRVPFAVGSAHAPPGVLGRYRHLDADRGVGRQPVRLRRLRALLRQAQSARPDRVVQRKACRRHQGPGPDRNASARRRSVHRTDPGLSADHRPDHGFAGHCRSAGALAQPAAGAGGARRLYSRGRTRRPDRRRDARPARKGAG